MNTTELLGHYRAQIVDETRPYLWSDVEAFVYMNEAQLQLCRMTEGIADVRTAEVVEIPVVTGQIFADAHPKILNFRQAVLASTGKKLDIWNHTDVRQWDEASGTVSAVIVGMQQDVVRWNFTPTADDLVKLMVFRLPLEDLTDVEQELEVDAKHHASLVHWMMYLSFMKPDTETYDRNAADRAKACFLEYCAEVNAELRRYRQKVRVVSYGGI